MGLQVIEQTDDNWSMCSPWNWICSTQWIVRLIG